MKWTIQLTAALLGVCGLLSSAGAAEAPRPNIVFILADDLGSHDVGWRGSEIKTPNLDKLANAGAKLEQFYVQPVCSPTRASLMTGRYPFRYGFQTGVVRPWAQYGVPLEERFLPQALKEAGYETAIVGKWHLGHFEPAYQPTHRGFDHQYGHYNGALDYFTHIRDGGFDWHRDDKVNRDEGYSTHLVGDEAAARIKQRDKSKPLFLYVPFNGVHAPLQVPESYSEPYSQFSGNRKTYAGMVTALDEAVGKVVDALRSEDIYSNTLIIFSSDNGGPNPQRLTSNGKLRAGKGTVYEGGVRVCALASWEGKIKPGTVVDQPLHMVDWHPTLIKLAGGKVESKLPLDGRDAWATISAGAASPHTDIVLNAGSNRNAIRVGDWKLVVRNANDTNLGEGETAETAAPNNTGAAANAKPGDKVTELYNLAADVSEKNDLAQSQPEKVKELLKVYEAYAAQAVPAKERGKAKNFESPKVWGQAD